MPPPAPASPAFPAFPTFTNSIVKVFAPLPKVSERAVIAQPTKRESIAIAVVMGVVFMRLFRRLRVRVNPRAVEADRTRGGDMVKI